MMRNLLLCLVLLAYSSSCGLENITMASTSPLSCPWDDARACTGHQLCDGCFLYAVPLSYATECFISLEIILLGYHLFCASVVNVTVNSMTARCTHVVGLLSPCRYRLE